MSPKIVHISCDNDMTEECCEKEPVYIGHCVKSASQPGKNP